MKESDKKRIRKSAGITLDYLDDLNGIICEVENTESCGAIVRMKQGIVNILEKMEYVDDCRTNLSNMETFSEFMMRVYNKDYREL